MQCIIPISGQKRCHPNDDKHEFPVTKKRLLTQETQKNARSMDVFAHAVI